MLFICFEFPFYSFNESKSKKSSFFNLIKNSYKNFKILSINSFDKGKKSTIVNDKVILKLQI